MRRYLDELGPPATHDEMLRIMNFIDMDQSVPEYVKTVAKIMLPWQRLVRRHASAVPFEDWTTGEIVKAIMSRDDADAC